MSSRVYIRVVTLKRFLIYIRFARITDIKDNWMSGTCPVVVAMVCGGRWQPGAYRFFVNPSEIGIFFALEKTAAKYPRRVVISVVQKWRAHCVVSGTSRKCREGDTYVVGNNVPWALFLNGPFCSATPPVSNRSKGTGTPIFVDFRANSKKQTHAVPYTVFYGPFHVPFAASK